MAKTPAVSDSNKSMSTFTDEKPEWMGDSQRGSENVAMQDMTIPRLAIIQSLSPQRLKQNEEYIKGAEEGMIFNTVTKKLYTPPITIVPVFFRKEVVVWKKRAFGGGFKSVHNNMADAIKSIMALPDKIQNDSEGKPTEAYEALDTAHQFVMVLEADGTITEAVMSLTKTGLTFSRKFNSLIALAGGDRFSRAFNLNTSFTKNDKGEFFTWKSEVLGFVSKEVYEHGEKLYKAVREGTKDVNYEGSSAEEDEAFDAVPM